MGKGNKKKCVTNLIMQIGHMLDILEADVPDANAIRLRYPFWQGIFVQIERQWKKYIRDIMHYELDFSYKDVIAIQEAAGKQWEYFAKRVGYQEFMQKYFEDKDYAMNNLEVHLNEFADNMYCSKALWDIYCLASYWAFVLHRTEIESQKLKPDMGEVLLEALQEALKPEGEE